MMHGFIIKHSNIVTIYLVQMFSEILYINVGPIQIKTLQLQNKAKDSSARKRRVKRRRERDFGPKKYTQEDCMYMRKNVCI